ncbi:hypothetical protein RQN30_01910 [Arcanobacterium hippocoleae]
MARCVHNAVGADVKNVRIAELDAAQALPIVFGSELAPQMRVNPGDSVGAGSAESCDNDLSSRQRRQQYAAEVWTFFLIRGERKNIANAESSRLASPRLWQAC